MAQLKTKPQERERRQQEECRVLLKYQVNHCRCGVHGGGGQGGCDPHCSFRLPATSKGQQGLEKPISPSPSLTGYPPPVLKEGPSGKQLGKCMKGLKRWEAQEGWPGFLQISMVCWIERMPRRTRTCHQPCPIFTDPENKDLQRQLHHWSHSATFRLMSALQFPSQRPLLGNRSPAGGGSSKQMGQSANAVSPCAPTMSPEWKERSLLTSILQPGCPGCAPGRKLAELKVNILF
jgi:hypothetical protein